MSSGFSCRVAVRPAFWNIPLMLVLIVLTTRPALVCAVVDDDVVVDGPINPGGVTVIRQIGVPNFEQMLFQNDRNKTAAEDRIRNRLELQLADLDRECQLTDVQKQKLQLAADGDFRRFFGGIAVLRAKFEKIVKDQNRQADAIAFDEAYQAMWQEINAMQQRMSTGLTDGDQSLVTKVLAQTLTAEQHAKYTAVTTERRQFRYEANIAVALHNLEDVIFLSNSQREEISKFLLQMPPPRQYEMQMVLCRIGMIPTEKLQPLFTAVQWGKLEPQLIQYRNIRQSYIQAGLLDPEDVPNPAAQEKP